MAKELPYFQFEPAQYLTGNIQFCSFEEQGIFINVCSIYWQRSCVATKEQLIRKFGSDNIHRLAGEGVIKFGENDVIIIEFLDEQFKSITASKSRLSEAGKKGALIKKQATLKPPLSHVEAPLKQPDKIREDKIREKEIILFSNSEVIERLKHQQYDDRLILSKTYGFTDTEFEHAVDMFCLEPENTNKDFSEVIRHFKKWVGTKVISIKTTAKDKLINNADREEKIKRNKNRPVGTYDKEFGG